MSSKKLFTLKSTGYSTIKSSTALFCSATEVLSAKLIVSCKVVPFSPDVRFLSSNWIIEAWFLRMISSSVEFAFNPPKNTVEISSPVGLSCSSYWGFHEKGVMRPTS